MAEPTNTPWRKPSRSGHNGRNRVEIADIHGTIAIRDSKNPEGSKLALSPSPFGNLTTALKHH